MRGQNSPRAASRGRRDLEPRAVPRKGLAKGGRDLPSDREMRVGAGDVHASP